MTETAKPLVPAPNPPVRVGEPVRFVRRFEQNGKVRAEPGETGTVEYADLHGALGWTYVVRLPDGRGAVLYPGLGFPDDTTRFEVSRG
jgi:hypothetical protein